MSASEETVLGGAEDFMTVRHLTLKGSNHEIGRRLGEIARERYDHGPERHAADPTIARARRVYLQRNHPIQWERARGAASAFGVDAEDYRYDFTGLPYHLDLPLPQAGCSVVYYPPSTTETGHGYLSRNYDFSTGTLAEVMGIPLPPGMSSDTPPVMSEPYVMEWYPEDSGYSSIAIHAFDLLGGTLDGMNGEGLVVSIMADDEAIALLGPRLEIHPGMPHAVGIHELQLMRLVLDTCATAEEAKETLLTAKQYYGYVPNHYIVADRAGNSFVYEVSTGRNVQHVIEGEGRPQVVTNFQLHKHPALGEMPDGPLTPETNAFWRYRTLAELIARHDGPFSLEDIKRSSACVNVRAMLDTLSQGDARSVAASFRARTLWHSIYDQEALTVQVSFYLRDRERGQEDGDPLEGEVRSKYLEFALGGKPPSYAHAGRASSSAR